jgi:hypothetical protein
MVAWWEQHKDDRDEWVYERIDLISGEIRLREI